MQRAFHLYGESRGNIDKVRKGLLISTVSGTTAYALAALEPRGTLFVGPACDCLLYTSPSPRDRQKSRMPSSA